MAEILCTGSVALDTTRTPFKVAKRVLGGSATYFSLAASHFCSVAVLGTVGKDFPKQHWKQFGKMGVDTSGIQRRAGKTMFFDSSFSYDMYARKANKLELNVYSDFNPKIPVHLLSSPYLYLGTLAPEKQLSVLREASSPKFVLMDTIEHYIETQREKVWKVISEVDAMVLNDVEARMLCKTTNLFQCARKIQTAGAGTVIIKKGENGSVLFHEDLVFPLSAYPLETVVDPTGAGDAFAGGFFGHIARKKKVSEGSLKEAMAYGNIMGSYAIEAFSVGKLVAISGKQIEERFRGFRKLLHF